MRIVAVFRKSLLEQIRDPWSLVLTLVVAPFFVLLYWAFFGGGSTTYGVLVLNEDTGLRRADGAVWNGGQEVIQALRDLTYAGGDTILRVGVVADRAQAEAKLKNREAAVLLVVPEGFSRSVYGSAGDPRVSGASVVVVGDLTNPQYTVAAVLASSAVDEYVQSVTGLEPPLRLVEQALGSSGARTEFEVYVPGVLVIAVVMLIFQSAMTVAREVEGGTLRRLQLTRMTSFDLLGGVSATQVLIGVVAAVLGFATAVALGFSSHGPLWVAVFAAAATALAVVGVGLVVACFARTVSQAFVFANFPLMLLMFFSGAVFPLPRLTVFAVGGREVGLFDFLPPTHAVVALNKVLALGATLADVAYELIAVLLLSALYYAAGVWLFERRYLRVG